MAEIEFGPFALDVERCELRRRGRVLPVQRKVFEFLQYLIEHRERLVSKQELLETVWRDTAVTETSLSRTAALARKALQDDAHEPRWIATRHGRGYRFIGELRAGAPELAVAPAPAPPSGASAAAGEGIVGRASEQAALSAALEGA